MAKMEILDFKDWMDNEFTKELPFLKHAMWIINKRQCGIPAIIGGFICGILTCTACYYNCPWDMFTIVGYSVLIGVVSIPIIFKILALMHAYVFRYPKDDNVGWETRYFRLHKHDANLYQYLRTTDVIMVLFGVIEAGDVTTLTEITRRLFDLPYNKYGTYETINLVCNIIRDNMRDIATSPYHVTDPNAPAINNQCTIKDVLSNTGEPNPLGKKLYHNKRWIKILEPIIDKGQRMKTKQFVDNWFKWREKFPEDQLKKLYVNMHNDATIDIVNSKVHYPYSH